MFVDGEVCVLVGGGEGGADDSCEPEWVIPEEISTKHLRYTRGACAS